MQPEMILDYGLSGLIIFIGLKYIALPTGRWIANYLVETRDKFINLILGEIKEVTSAVKSEGQRTRNAIRSTKLPDNKIIEIASKYVGEASFEKIKYLRDVLDANDIINREKQIRNNIRSRFDSISAESYINPLNDYVFGTGDRVGDWIKENVNDDEFYDTLFKIFFRPQIGDDYVKEKHNKVNDILALIISHNNKMWEKCKRYLNYEKI